MTKINFIIFQLDGKIDDGESGRDLWYEIARKQNEESITKAFKDGLYQLTHFSEKSELNEVYAELNSPTRVTGQFCSSLSTGDLIYDVEKDQFFAVANYTFRMIDIDFNFNICPTITNGTVAMICKECDHIVEIPMIWIDRFIKASLQSPTHRCPKCRVVSRHGIETWEMIQKEQAMG